MGDPLSISVVMPSLNQGRFIRDAIESVLSQDYEYVKLLVMDGGSTDDTLDILKSFGDRMRWVSEKDAGQSDAINRGFLKITGDILCWLNSDDLFEPRALSVVAKAFQSNPEVQFVYGLGYNVTEQNQMMGTAGVKPFNLWKLIHHRNFIQQPSCFFRRALLEKVGPIRLDLHYVMDWELWIRFALYKGMFVNRYLSRNRTYSDNKTMSGGLRRWFEIRRMLSRYTDKKLTPAVVLYFIEAMLQSLRGKGIIDELIGLPLRFLFFSGMEREFSGCFPDGSVSKHFYFTIPNPEAKSEATILMSPISAYDNSLLGSPPVRIRWKSSEGNDGTFTILQNGRPQTFIIPLNGSEDNGFVHISCHTPSAGYPVSQTETLPKRAIACYLDEIRKSL